MRREIRMMPVICDNVSYCFMAAAHIDFKYIFIRFYCTTAPITEAYGADSHGGLVADVPTCQWG